MNFMNHFEKPLIYGFSITGSDSEKYYILDGNEKKTFSKSATDRCGKIYIFLQNNEVVYVGTTVRSISSRLRDSFTGYYKYKFIKSEDKKFQLVIYCLKQNHELALNSDGDIEANRLSKDNMSSETRIKQSLLIENIEAELSLLVRNELGRWAKFQNEIHFNNFLLNGKELAEEVYQNLKEITKKTV